MPLGITGKLNITNLIPLATSESADAFGKSFQVSLWCAVFIHRGEKYKV